MTRLSGYASRAGHGHRHSLALPLRFTLSQSQRPKALRKVPA